MKKPLVSFAGNHLGDDPRFGNVFAFEANAPITAYPYINDANSAFIKQNISSDPGLSGTVDQWMRFTPINEPGIAVAANASLVAPAGTAGAVPLALIRPQPGTPNATTGFAYDTIAGVPMVRLDYERSILMKVLADANNLFTIKVNGADSWGQLMSASSVVHAGNHANAFIEIGSVVNNNATFTIASATQKTFAYVQNISVSGATGQQIWVGVGNTFGFDYYCQSAGDLVRVSLNGMSLSIDTVPAAGTNLFIAPPQLSVYQTVPPVAPNFLGNFFWATPAETNSAPVRGAYRIGAAGVALGAGLVNMQYKCLGASPFAAYVYNPQGGNPNNYGGAYSDSAASFRTGLVAGAPQFYNSALA